MIDIVRAKKVPAALPLAGATTGDWAAVTFLGVFQIALAYVFMVHGMQRVGALEASLLILLEPVLSPIWAWIVHGEKPADLALVGGAIIVETIFQWPGMGMLGWRATTTRDYPVLMGITLLSATMILISNLITDLAYAVADPRIRYN